MRRMKPQLNHKMLNVDKNQNLARELQSKEDCGGGNVKREQENGKLTPTGKI